MMKKLVAFVPLFLMSGLACGITPGGTLSETNSTPIAKRRGTVIADGCQLDSWQMDTLGTAAAKLVIHDVVLDCLLPHADGTVTPADASSQAELAALVANLQKLGYGVSLAVSFTTDNGYTYDGTETAAELADVNWSTSVANGIAAVATAAVANGIELDLEKLPASAKPNVTRLVSMVAAKVRPTKQLGVFLPPSTVSPSDVDGGDAFDVVALSSLTDRFRVMTLDFSGNQPGPTIDTGWAVDALRFAQQSSGNAALDVAYPLYGNDFATTGTASVRFTTFLEADGLAANYKKTATRAPSQELTLDYTDDANQSHELWYDDSVSTLVALHAWDAQTLPTTTGVVYYGFGAEDPALWAAIAGASQ